MSFLTKHDFKFADFDGCMYGLRARGGRGDGELIKKPWRVACSPNSSLPQFLCKRCDGTHRHVHCAGAYTLKTQGYTPEVVKQVHMSLNADLNRKPHYTADWDDGAFICIEVPTGTIDLDSFSVAVPTSGTMHAASAPCIQALHMCNDTADSPDLVDGDSSFSGHFGSTADICIDPFQ